MKHMAIFVNRKITYTYCKTLIHTNTHTHTHAVMAP
jgi:hypothetical protein